MLWLSYLSFFSLDTLISSPIMELMSVRDNGIFSALSRITYWMKMKSMT